MGRGVVMNFIRVFLCVVLVVLLVRADFEIPKEAEIKAYKFGFPDSHKKSAPVTAKIKFEERKKSVKIEFEGSGLKKGKYRIVKIQDCEAFKKSLIKSKQTFEEEVFSFETEYGEISDEKVISVDSLKDLGLDEKFLALLKVEKKSDIFIACSVI